MTRELLLHLFSTPEPLAERFLCTSGAKILQFRVTLFCSGYPQTTTSETFPVFLCRAALPQASHQFPAHA